MKTIKGTLVKQAGSGCEIWAVKFEPTFINKQYGVRSSLMTEYQVYNQMKPMLADADENKTVDIEIVYRQSGISLFAEAKIIKIYK